MTSIQLRTPLTDTYIRRFRVGDQVSLSGVIYTARDAAHKRLTQSLIAGRPLPIPIVEQIIYYVGPAPAKPGMVIGPAGPTTASRVDTYTPQLLEAGLKGMIGKGKRSIAVREAMVQHKAVYFVLVGGAAALIADHILKVDVVAYDDLSTEAIRRLEVEALPMIVANDVYGNDLFEMGQAKYRRKEPQA